MRILWIEDTGKSKHIGGATYTNNTMRKEGEQRGHTISTITKETKTIPSNDIIILDNITRFNKQFIQQIINTSNYIKYEHDYYSLNRIKEFPTLFNNSLCNIFLSPLHKKQYNTINNNKTYCIPSPINTKQFQPHKKQENTGIWIATNTSNTDKGYANFIKHAKEHPNTRYQVYGHTKPQGLNLAGTIINTLRYHQNTINTPNNCALHGYIPQTQIPEAYKTTKEYVFLPNWKEPFGRTTAEATLSGCKITGNNNIGALSWKWKNQQETRKAIEKAPKQFWEAIEKEANQ